MSMSNKLRLNEPMKRTYLIQRLHVPHQFGLGGVKTDNPFTFGAGLKNGGLSDVAMDLIGDIWAFDYMGSAEFEWGAVPQALAFIAEQTYARNLCAGTIHLGNNSIVYYITPTTYEKEVTSRIGALHEDEKPFDLKEPCGLSRYFKSDNIYRNTVGWLEIDNGFIFFVDKEMFDKTCILFGI